MGSHPAASLNKNESLEQSLGPDDEIDESADWDSSKKLIDARQAKISQMQPIDLNSIEFSLDHDAKQGYKPNLQNIQGPLPFLYLSHNQLKVIENFLGLGETCIYKSKRPGNSFELHLRNLESGSRYEVTDPSFLMLTNKTVQKLMQPKKPLLSKKPSGLPDLQKALPVSPTVAPPDAVSSVNFEADFEHGNLDLAFASPEGSFTLLLRPDTNSKGHNQWFYFKVTSSQKKHLRLNIINLVKPKSIFGRGGFPYIGTKGDGSGALRWTQLTESCKLSYTRTKARYELGDTSVASTRRRQYMTLSFEVPIDARQELWFAYSIPYSYSDLLGFLGGLADKYSPANCQLQTLARPEKNPGLSKTAPRERMKPSAPQTDPLPKVGSKPGSSACNKVAFRAFECDRLKLERLCKSESLLDLPMLTITDSTTGDAELIPQQDRPIVYIVSRVHPSESVSSYSVEGLIDRLLDDSLMSKLMRQLFVFKIVPMMNPDGVIIGNFRTNFSGDDLNRRYDTPSSFFHPSVEYFLTRFSTCENSSSKTSRRTSGSTR